MFRSRRLALLVLIASLIVVSCSRGSRFAAPSGDLSSAPRSEPVTFRVAVPPGMPPSDTLYLAGDFQGWNPHDPRFALHHESEGRWSISLALPPGVPIEFKFTRGGWDRVEKGPLGEELANRALVPAAGARYDFTVARWADPGRTSFHAGPSTIVGHVETFADSNFLGGRRLWVYLPPDYASGTRRYPVLYMHDGQNLFDARTSFAGEWQVDETCERLIASGAILPLIVVGIENAGERRTIEYTPWPDAGRGGQGGGGETYLRAIRDVLKPLIDRRYRTLPDRDHTWMAGSSLGGLISAYAGLHDSETFGRVACVSPSLWWDDQHLLREVESLGRPGVTRWYQDMGTLEQGRLVDLDQNRVDDAVDGLRRLRDLLKRQGMREGVDLMSVEGEGQRHHESAWAQRLPALLEFLAAP